MGSGITRLLSPNQGSDLLHGLKISYHNIFPHNKVSVHRISWPRYIRNGEMGLRDQNNGKKIGISGSRIYHVTTLVWQNKKEERKDILWYGKKLHILRYYLLALKWTFRLTFTTILMQIKYTLFFLYKNVFFFRPRLNILIFLQILG